MERSTAMAMTYEQAREFMLEYFTTRRKLVIADCAFEDLFDAMEVIDDKWAAKLGISVYELDKESSALVGWKYGRDHEYIDYLEGKIDTLSPEYSIEYQVPEFRETL
jgi:hypothetical protein